MRSVVKIELKKWIENNQSLLKIKNYRLIDISSGESNYVYKIAGEKSLIVRTNKPPATDRSEQYVKILKFVNNYIVNTPEVILFEKQSTLDQPIIVESFVGKKKFNETNINPNFADQIAKLLAEIHFIPISKYNSFLGKDEPEKESLAKYLNGLFVEFSEKPYKDYLEKIDKPDQRIKKYYKKQIKLTQEYSFKKIMIKKL